MATQNDIYIEIEHQIPASLWDQYRHLSFGEMAEVPELAAWADALRTAEQRWWELEN